MNGELRTYVGLGQLACLVSAPLLFILPSQASGRTWRVPSNSGTIQAAIDDAAEGDTVLVAAGTYQEALTIQGKNLVLLSISGPEATIVDASLYVASALLLRDGIDNSTVIDGFTFTGGSGTDPYSTGVRTGGGIECLNAAPIFRRNVVKGNRAEDIPPRPSGGSRGGGISFGGPDWPPFPIVIEDNVIEDNFAVANGGGINVGDNCVIKNNTIRRNSTEHGDGAGIYCYLVPGPILIEANVITQNVAADHGGGIYVGIPYPSNPPPGDVQIVSNVIVGNEAHEYLAMDGAGGGVWLGGGASLYGNTIAFNLAESGQDPVVGGVCILDPRPGTLLENNLIQGNSEGGIVALDGDAAGAVLVKHNLLYRNGTQDIYEAGSLLNEVENLFTDGYFCVEGAGSFGDLAENSPALLSPYGVIGAVESPGCGPAATRRLATWGAIKAMWSVTSRPGGIEGRKPSIGH